MNSNLYKINEVTQHKYYQVPKELYTNPRYKTTINNDAKMLYALLLDRMELSRTNGWIEDDGTIFLIFKREDLADMLDICSTTVWRAIKQLKEVGLIEEKRQGLNRPNLIYIGKIDYSVLEEKEPESIEKEIISSSSAPSTSILSSGIENLKDRTSTAERSGDLKNKCQDISKLKPNKTDNNNTEMNKPDPIHSGDIREQLEDYFYQELEVELLLRLFPDDEDTIYQIVDLLVDTCATKRRMLRIAGDDKPAEVVRSRLKKLNADHIRFVLNSLAENATPVRNMKQYLLASLYNAPTTMNLHYQNLTNHDFAHGSRKAG